MNRAIVLGAVTFVAVALAIPGMLRLARYLDLLDHPNDRSLHVIATPRGGGLPIVVVVLLAALLGTSGTTGIAAFCAGAALVAGVGWIDDRRSVGASLRLVAHAMAAAVIIVGVGAFHRLPLPGPTSVALGAFAVPLTILWIVGLINAYNFMDGIDGLAAGQGALGGVLWAVAGARAGLPDVTVLGALLAGTCLAFLLYNWSPARLFMGDVGSGFLGFAFASLAVLATVGSGDARFVVAGALFVGLFLFDTCLTVVRRAWRHENLLRAHRGHLYQRLVACGYSHRLVAAGCLSLGAVLGYCGLLVMAGSSSGIGFAAALLLGYWWLVMYAERRALARAS